MCLEATMRAAPARAEADRRALSRRTFLKAGAMVGAAAGLGAVPAPALAWPKPSAGRRRAVDLSHVFRAGFPVYLGDPPARETLFNIPDNGFYTQRWTFAEHSGTHMDAPGHFTLGGRLSPDITPDELILPAVVIDIADRAAADPDAEVVQEDLVRFERRHGRIPDRAAVLMHSGWETRADDPDAFRNVGPDGLFHFPGFSLEAVEWLVSQRNIGAIGVDTLSLDNGPSQTFVVHRFLLGEDRYGLENVRNLKAIPPRGATILVGLIPWEEGSGGPCRVMATW